MNSLYGNIITHIPRSSFYISRTYPNVSEMFAGVTDDKVPLYSYILIDYNYTNPNATGDLYQFNNNVDQNKYGSDKLIINYDQTVWQKQLDYNDNLIYRAIARLNSILPNFEGPGSYFKKEESLVTFQRLNAIPIVYRDIPKTYQDFGVCTQNIPIISFDQNAIDIFNSRYPTPRNEIPMQINEKYPSMSIEDSHEYELKIQNQINNSTNSDDISYYTEMLNWYLNNFLPSLTTLSVNEIPEKLKQFNSDTLEYPTK